ncbi:MAG: TIGR03617 family F420-dependent LLM class oxidoreductase [Pseudomonadota bacterium]
MEFDIKAQATPWDQAASNARQFEKAGFSGVLYTEGRQVPWMMIAAAAMAAPTLQFSTGIAVAFPRSPMMAAQIAWELAANTQGRFRMGLGSQVRAHVVRRYGATFEKPAPQMRDYVAAVRASLRAFRGEEKLAHEGPYYSLNLLPPQWTPARHDYDQDIKIDISAVGPYMCEVAGELADGVHVHPMHSMNYINNRLLPAVRRGADRAGRSPGAIDLIVPVFAIAGDSAEERAALVKQTKTQIGFYGATPNYAFQFDDLGFGGVTKQLGERLRAGDIDGMTALVTDEMLAQFALVARWDDLADRLIERYRGVAARVVMYLTYDHIAAQPDALARWSEIAKAVRAA